MKTLDFNHIKLNKNIKFKSDFSVKDIDIITTILAAINQFTNYNIEKLSEDTPTKNIFNNVSFEKTFCSLIFTFELQNTIKKNEIPIGNQFEMYPDYQSLVYFFIEKSNNLNK